MNIFHEIEQATEDWKLAHGIKEQINAAAQETASVEHNPVSPTVVLASAAPLTFADIECGEEFVDQDGNTWEKRSEHHAIHFDWPVWQRADFKTDEPVRRK